MSGSNSEESSIPSRPVRAKKVKTEDDLIRDMLKIQNQLLSEHKTASLFTFSSKYGQLQFGSNNAVNKFRNDFDNDADWLTAFEEDGEELIHGDQVHEYDSDGDELNQAKAPQETSS